MSETKVCRGCKQELPLTTEFYSHRSDRPHLWVARCKVCLRPPKKGPAPSRIVDGMICCLRCGIWKPATKEVFGVNRQARHEYLRSYCKPCQTIRHAEWVAANPTKVKAINKRSYGKNQQARVAASTAWDRKQREDPIRGPIHRARRRFWGLRHRERHLEEIRARDRAYAKTEAGSARYTRRRAKKAGAVGHHTRGDVMKIARAQRFRCFWCGADIKGTICEDHFIPLSKGGSDYASNIVAACGRCNSRKHNKMPGEFMDELMREDAISFRQLARVRRSANWLRFSPRGRDQDISVAQLGLSL